MLLTTLTQDYVYRLTGQRPEWNEVLVRIYVRYIEQVRLLLAEGDNGES